MSPPPCLFPTEVARSSIMSLKIKVLLTQLCPAGVGNHYLLPGIFPTQGANPGLLHCRQTLYCLLFSHLVLSSSLRPHGPQHARFPCPSPSPGACSNSCPLSQWCHLTISSSVIPFSPSLRVFLNKSVLRIRWPKYWSFSFSISPSNEYSGLMFRMD